MAYGNYGFKTGSYGMGPAIQQPAEQPKPPAVDMRKQMQEMIKTLMRPDEGSGQTPDFTNVFGPTHHGD